MATTRTRLCAAVGIQLPIIQAPIGSATTPELVAAVSEAGALGTLAGTWLDDKRLAEWVHAIRRATSRPFGVNFVLEWDMRSKVEVALEAGAPVITFFWGDPAPFVDVVHQAGALVAHTVGSPEEASSAIGAGVDVVIAQGIEAGGHVRGEMTTMTLVPAVLDLAGRVPVVAAGGLVDARGVRAALALGASGAMLGTRFLVAEEANTHHVYRQAVLRATGRDTVQTGVFDVGWPNAPHRSLRNSTLRNWEAAGRPAPGHRPGERDPVARRDGRTIVRYGDDIPTRDTRGDLEALAMYAGQGVGGVTAIEPAADIVASLAAQADERLVELVRDQS